MVSYAILIALFFISWTCFLWFRSGKKGKLPPGPRPLPIVGNMFQLGSKPHETLAELAKTYGPLMLIHLGSVYTLVISSPEMAHEIFQKYGQVFSSRHIPEAAHACNHSKISVGFMPVAEPKWRDLRKICKEQMFDNPSLEGSQVHREEKLQQLLDYVQRCSDEGRAVDIREAGFITTLNLMTATLFSFQATEFESKATKEFMEIVEGIATMTNGPNFADYFPILRRIDPQGVMKRAEYYFGQLLDKIDGYLVERLESRGKFPDAPKKTDLLETLLDISAGNDYQITHDDIKHLLLDLIVAGTGTNTASIEWIMSELVLNPDKLAKLKQELKSVVGVGKQVLESDIPRLPYLQAVVKETFRYHPPGPLSLPRAAVRDQEINGYLIPKGTQILTNLWAMGRDPSIWTNPESFEPERFLDKKIDFKGQDFELLPFGSGRRICPGLPLASRIVHMTIAALIHNFDWKFEVEDSNIDNSTEVFGLVVRRTVPLRVIPVKH